MKHLDGEAIALLALGEPADDAARAHLEGCQSCRAELTELTSLVGAAREGGPDLEPPSDAVWARIRSRIDDGVTGSGPVTGSEDAGRRPARSPSGSRPADTRPPRRRRRVGARTWSFLAGAVAAALVVVAVVWAVGVRSPDRVLASADLAPLGQATGSGSAELQRTADGIDQLRLQVGGDRVRGYPEVWLIAKDGKRMVSLGTLHDGSAVLPVPAGLDVRDYATVDVSDEPLDGNPAHSGDSILRGSLTF
ncbi:hypothetical protein GCM10011512_02520 [Tersicoccus solisilvae]|uniref:Anti-sigma K factor RskA C-terminal domain-containing protein n=1 Tax=Tersicoccus solisilvae TaxID=1882339 RepID=A0ABQ1NMX2_9MICC|nr:anti-sigma factor [Tersicoccus solisilvae]GGC79368.1 hypothetical protein GCM10011512_02520 [Tersicoccus solisilvae]